MMIQQAQELKSVMPEKKRMQNKDLLQNDALLEACSQDVCKVQGHVLMTKSGLNLQFMKGV
eukprot:4273874-Karenia_brevis.AAC.1